MTSREPPSNVIEFMRRPQRAGHHRADPRDPNTLARTLGVRVTASVLEAIDAEREKIARGSDWHGWRKPTRVEVARMVLTAWAETRDPPTAPKAAASRPKVKKSAV